MEDATLSTEALDYLEAGGRQIVAELLGNEGVGDRLAQLFPAGGDGYEQELADRELAMIAAGVETPRVYLRLAVLRAARDAVRTLAAIRSLPETAEPGLPARRS